MFKMSPLKSVALGPIGKGGKRIPSKPSTDRRITIELILKSMRKEFV